MKMRKLMLGFLSGTFRILAATIIVAGALLSVIPAESEKGAAAGGHQFLQKAP